MKIKPRPRHKEPRQIRCVALRRNHAFNKGPICILCGWPNPKFC